MSNVASKLNIFQRNGLIFNPWINLLFCQCSLDLSLISLSLSQLTSCPSSANILSSLINTFHGYEHFYHYEANTLVQATKILIWNSLIVSHLTSLFWLHVSICRTLNESLTKKAVIWVRWWNVQLSGGKMSVTEEVPHEQSLAYWVHSNETSVTEKQGKVVKMERTIADHVCHFKS